MKLTPQVEEDESVRNVKINKFESEIDKADEEFDKQSDIVIEQTAKRDEYIERIKKLKEETTAFKTQLKELETKRDELLDKIRQTKIHQYIQPADLTERIVRYNKADVNYNNAKDEYNAFLAETWNPLEGDLPKQEKFKEEKERLYKNFITARDELKRSRIAVTESERPPIKVSATIFDKFVRQMETRRTSGELAIPSSIAGFDKPDERDHLYPKEAHDLVNYIKLTDILPRFMDIATDLSKIDLDELKRTASSFVTQLRRINTFRNPGFIKTFFDKIMALRGIIKNPQNIDRKKYTKINPATPDDNLIDISTIDISNLFANTQYAALANSINNVEKYSKLIDSDDMRTLKKLFNSIT